MPASPAPAPLAATAAALLALAPAQDPHWSFRPPERVVPAVGDAAWCRDDLDRCVLAGLEAHGLRPSPAASPEVLLRRVHLVTTGLPPTPAELAAFVATPTDAAYAAVVDDLLARPACAEHLATAWLDLARFADTYGFQSDFECRTWPWRDWLLQSLLTDKPWDRFVLELLAGDLLRDATVETRTATAFWRLHRQTNEGGSIDEEWRHEYIADRVDTFGTTFLGLTLGCAKCHDHKSDPIRQRDYYALGSFFALDEAGLYPHSTGATPQPAARLCTAEQAQQIDRLEQAVRAAEAARADIAETALDVRPTTPTASRQPVARFLGTAQNRHLVDTVDSNRKVKLPDGCRTTTGPAGEALEFDGDARLAIPKLPAFDRAAPRSVRLVLWCPDHKERAVVLHTSHYTQDADTQGYQVLLEDGRLAWQLVHHWPGSAIAVRTRDALPLQRWLDVVVTYDGSSSATGLQVFVDGAPAAVEIVRDHLAGPATVRPLELGGRDRDRGFAGGRIAEFALFDQALTAAEVAMLAGQQPSAAAALDHALACNPEVVAADAALQQARAALHAYVEAIPELMVMAESRYPRPRFVLRRGAYDQPDPAQPVTRGVPGCLPPLAPLTPNARYDRRHLAEWLVDPRHPLSARVAVDRLWANCFGRGLVATPENFGVLGQRPLQQPLLDLLAVDFAQDRSQRRLLRRILLSATFRQASAATPVAREADPQNERLARGPAFRLSAEVLRDQALAAAGLLHHEFGGPSKKPWQPPGLWQDAGVAWAGADYRPDEGPDGHRRSLYSYRKRTAPPPNQLLLDGPTRETCVPRRQETTTPLQALAFFNDPVFVECADALAAAACSAHQAPLDRLDFVFRRLAARAPRPGELDALRPLLDASDDQAKALALVASTLLASDATVMLR